MGDAEGRDPPRALTVARTARSALATIRRHAALARRYRASTAARKSCSQSRSEQASPASGNHRLQPTLDFELLDRSRYMITRSDTADAERVGDILRAKARGE